MHIHFVGINGCGISGVACAAKKRGFIVSGCDAKSQSSYSPQLLQNQIIPYTGHHKDHLENVDLVAISPALLYQDKYKTIEELYYAHKKNILIKWQQFLGEYILKDKETIAVCGTHGKTTTTTLLSLVFENTGYDPTAFVGGIVPEWNSTYRLGNSDWHICEADEYDYNFIYYHPKYILITNIEMEHPERFSSFDEYKKTFSDFLKTIRNNGKIIFNLDDQNSIDLLIELQNELKQKNVELIGYTVQDKISSQLLCQQIFKIENISFQPKTEFSFNHQKYALSLMGLHNVYHAAAVLSFMQTLSANANTEKIQSIFLNTHGSKRRLEKIFDNNTIKIYNDYAHHHSQVDSCIEALKNNTGNTIIAVLEPHQVSRIVQNRDAYLDALNKADYFIITKIFKGREEDKEIPDIENFLKDFKEKSKYICDRSLLLQEIKNQILNILQKNPKEKISILIMGAGDSHKIADDLSQMLKNEISIASSS
jgi:UDP-N-acetylmuramate--alanine ligase